MEWRRERNFILAIKLHVTENFSKIILFIYLTVFLVFQDLVCHTEEGTQAERVLKYGAEEDILA